MTFPNKNSRSWRVPTYQWMNQIPRFTANPAYRSIQRNSIGNWLRTRRDFQKCHIKFFYTILPRFHYPLGHSYSTKQKEAILVTSWSIWCLPCWGRLSGRFDKRMLLPLFIIWTATGLFISNLFPNQSFYFASLPWFLPRPSLKPVGLDL